MSTIAPDQLPVPTTGAVPSGHAPAAASTRRPTSRATTQRVAALCAGVAALAGGIAGVVRAASGDDATSTARPPQASVQAPGEAGSTDLGAAYRMVIGASPSEATLACVASAAGAVRADVDAVVAGRASDRQQVVSGLQPFASCAPAADFEVALVPLAASVVAPMEIDDACVRDVIATFTAADHLDVLVTAYLDVAQFQERMYQTFAPCSF